MVLAERNSENVRNGRRSRGPSPNAQTDSSSEEDGGINSIPSYYRYQSAIIVTFVALRIRVGNLENCFETFPESE